MPIDKKLVQKRFSRAAGTYDGEAVVQKNMADQLMKVIEEVLTHEQVTNILEIGCGTGYLTGQLLKLLDQKGKLPLTEVFITDISGEMLYTCRRKVEKQFGLLTNLTFQQEDGETIKLSKTVNLIVSNAVFQWFQDLNSALGSLYNVLSKDGWLLFTTFGENTFQELHRTFNHVLGYRPGQPFVSAPEVEKMMKENNFIDVKVLKETQRQYFGQVQDFFKAIKRVGASNACTLPNNRTNYLGKHNYEKIFYHYQKNNSTPQGVFCTYEILYCYGRRI